MLRQWLVAQAGRLCWCKGINFKENNRSKLPYLACVIAHRGTRVTHGCGGRLVLNSVLVSFVVVCRRCVFQHVQWLLFCGGVGRLTWILNKLVEIVSVRGRKINSLRCFTFGMTDEVWCLVAFG